MSSKETPIDRVKRQHASKEKLVNAIVAALDDLGDDTEDLSERLATSSNKKLLRLAAVTAEIKQRYGTREKLVEAIAGAVGKSKDADYITSLGTRSLPSLLDKAKVAERRRK